MGEKGSEATGLVLLLPKPMGCCLSLGYGINKTVGHEKVTGESERGTAC